MNRRTSVPHPATAEVGDEGHGDLPRLRVQTPAERVVEPGRLGQDGELLDTPGQALQLIATCDLFVGQHALDDRAQHELESGDLDQSSADHDGWRRWLAQGEFLLVRDLSIATSSLSVIQLIPENVR